MNSLILISIHLKRSPANTSRVFLLTGAPWEGL